MSASNQTHAATDAAEVVISEDSADLTGPANLLNDVPELAPSHATFERIETLRNYRGPARTECDNQTWDTIRAAVKVLVPYVKPLDAYQELPPEVGYALMPLQHSRPAKQLFLDFCEAAGISGGWDEWWEERQDSKPTDFGGPQDYKRILTAALCQGWIAMSDPPPSPGPSIQLQNGVKGKPLSNVKNAVTVLAAQTALFVVYDEFQGKALVRWPDDDALRPVNDEDITRVRLELQGKFGMDQTSAETAYAALRFVARRNTVNCVRDWLNSLTWDGEHRLSKLMPRGFGTPSERYYLRAGRNLLISMVARATVPGCKVDEAVVLEGAQGSLKSSALGVIGGEFFKELTAHPNSKDFEQQLVGVWLGEFAELNALRRPEDIARIKQFITCREDHIRLPYDRTVSDLPRRIVLCGSTNEENWLHDLTGGRRFIPIPVGKIDLQWLRENREQLFAEAVALYKAGRKWWVFPKEVAIAEQEARTPEDPWTAKIRTYLQGRPEIHASELLDWALGIPTERQNKGHSTRAGIILKKLGCTQQNRRRVDGTLRRPWNVPVEFACLPVVVAGPVQFTPVDHQDLVSGGAA
jgi:hypothetical protein